MPQLILFLDDEENKKIMKHSDKWKLSKSETIKKIIKLFEEKEDGDIR